MTVCLTSRAVAPLTLCSKAEGGTGPPHTSEAATWLTGHVMTGRQTPDRHEGFYARENGNRDRRAHRAPG